MTILKFTVNERISDNLTQQFDRNIAWFEQVAGSQITSSIKSVKNDIIFVEKTIDRLSVAVPQPFRIIFLLITK